MSKAMFNYNETAEQMGISKETLDMIVKEAEIEFPFDEMLRELHIVRAIRAYATRSKKAVS